MVHRAVLVDPDGIYEDGAVSKGAACLAAILMGKTNEVVRCFYMGGYGGYMGWGGGGGCGGG